MKITVLNLTLLLIASPVAVAFATAVEDAAGTTPGQKGVKEAPVSSMGTVGTSCPFSQQNPCVIELHGAKAPSASPNCTVEPWSRFVTFTLPDRIADSNRDGWWETVIKIALDVSKGCSGATFRVLYDKPDGLYSLNIGDSPTNNGFGGDAGSTSKAAEMQIHQGRLEVYTSPVEEGVGNVDLLYRMTIPTLPRRTLELEVRDESLAFSIPGASGGAPSLSWKLDTSFSGLLYDLSPSAYYDGSTASKRRADGIYAAFNRVIHDKSGAPSPIERTGSGVRRVEIRLAP